MPKSANTRVPTRVRRGLACLRAITLVANFEVDHDLAEVNDGASAGAALVVAEPQAVRSRFEVTTSGQLMSTDLPKSRPVQSPRPSPVHVCQDHGHAQQVLTGGQLGGSLRSS